MKSIATFGLVVLVAACGGESASDGAGSGGAGVGGSAGATGTGAQAGVGGSPSGSFAWPPDRPSFLLKTLDQAQSLTGPAFAETRLDFHENAGAFEAAIGSTVGCSVSVSEKEIAISGCAKKDSRTIESLVIPRAADGNLTGAFQATSGYDGLYQGDMIVNEKIEFSGSVEIDDQAPELEISSDVALPWNGVRITASEGVGAEALAAAATVAPQNGAPIAISWQAELGTPEWSGATAMVGTFSDWAALADGPSLQITLAQVPDLNGNSSAVTQGFASMLAIGKPAVVHDFESGLSLSATGTAALASGTDVCEAGACVTLGPGDTCKGAGGTVRGLLDTTGLSNARIRSRVVAGLTAAIPTFELRLIAPSGQESATSVGYFDAAATQPVLGLGYGASFGDDVVPLPATASVTGFEIRLKTSGSGYFCNAGATAALVIEKIAAE